MPRLKNYPDPAVLAGIKIFVGYNKTPPIKCAIIPCANMIHLIHFSPGFTNEFMPESAATLMRVYARLFI
jgi:hypothetical protein